MKMWTKVAAIVGISMACALAFGTDIAVLQNGFSIRHEHREVIGSITRLYTGADNTNYVDVPTLQIAHFEQDMTTPISSATAQNPATPMIALAKPAIIAPVKPAIRTPGIDEVINSASDQTQIDPDLISSVIHAESGFNPRARSPKGAQGLMQLMPQTAANLGVSNAFDPGANVDGGTRYLRQLLELYNFDLVKALAAYNAGPLRVQQYHGIPPYNETHAYVARIIRDFNRKKVAEQKAAALSAKKKPVKPQAAASVTQVTVEAPRSEANR